MSLGDTTVFGGLDGRASPSLPASAVALPGRYPRPAGQFKRVAGARRNDEPGGTWLLRLHPAVETRFKRPGYRNRTCNVQIKGLVLCR
ncbi:MAG: hypothetical protein K2R98_19720 [Gemmataceae bacterium]|nr:hypothetical protein [Gemmataceae bacterium]